MSSADEGGSSELEFAQNGKNQAELMRMPHDFNVHAFLRRFFLSFDLILRHLHQTSQFQPKRLSVRNPDCRWQFS